MVEENLYPEELRANHLSRFNKIAREIGRQDLPKVESKKKCSENCKCNNKEIKDENETKYDKKSTYYSEGKIEVLDFIKAKLTCEQYAGYLMGCCIKYLGRMNFKNSMARDAEKVQVYAKLLAELLVEID